jgi:hypothetical protein
MTQTRAHQIPSLEDYLARTAASAHSLIISTYNTMLADPSIGKTRKQSMEIGGWAMTSQRSKEASGALQTWTDGTMVRVGTVSIFTHVLDQIVISHPACGPARKARTPVKSFKKGHRRTPTPAEPKGLRRGSENRNL